MIKTFLLDRVDYMNWCREQTCVVMHSGSLLHVRVFSRRSAIKRLHPVKKHDIQNGRKDAVDKSVSFPRAPLTGPFLFILRSLISKAEWGSQLLQLHHRSRSKDCRLRMSASAASRLPLTSFCKRAAALRQRGKDGRPARFGKAWPPRRGCLSISWEPSNGLLSQV